MHFSEKDKDPVKTPWYETGYYTLHPENRWFKIWVFVKSLMYLMDIYDVTYSAAFNFERTTEPFFMYLVNAINIIDCVLHFFTAVHIRELNEYTAAVRNTHLE